jgi:hypothetical protein
MTRHELYQTVEAEVSLYIEAKVRAYATTGKVQTDIFRAFNSDNEVVIDFCSWVLARRDK